MSRKLTALLLIALMGLSLVACGSKPAMSAAVRGPETDNGIIYFDEEAVALVGSVQDANMTDAEKERAVELRAIAVAAFDLANAKRAEGGLTPFDWNDGLETCAQVRATEIVGTFSHTRPNSSDWWTVDSTLMWGENLAKGYNDAESLVDAWMNSPTHAANILDGGFTSCSIAVYEADGKLFFAQEFGY